MMIHMMGEQTGDCFFKAYQVRPMFKRELPQELRQKFSNFKKMKLSRLSFIRQGSAKDGSVSVDLPKGRYAGLLVRIFGTTDTGKTLALSNVGKLRVQRNGKEVIGETFEFFNQYSNLKGGLLPTVSGSAATAEDIMCFIPFAIPEMRNCSAFRTNEEADLNCDFDASTLTTQFGSNSCTYQIYGYMMPEIAERYQLLIREQDIQASSAGRITAPLNGKNLAVVYLEDDSDKVDSTSLVVDDVVVVDAIDEDVIRHVTGFENRIESSNVGGLAEMSLIQTGQPENAINGGGSLDLTFNGAGTLKVTVFQIQDAMIARS